jgi:glutaconate CoA-transferase subunit A
VEAAFLALTVGGKLRAMPALKRAIEADTVDWTEHDGYRVVQRLRAAGMGVPFLPAPDVELCALASADPPRFVEDPFTGRRVAVEAAVYPDVALVHAHAADAQGNLYIEDPTTDLLVAHAARRVLATVETRVERLPRVTLPGFQVEQLAHVPGGALPTGCVGRYPHDEAWLLAYLEADRAGRGLAYLLANQPAPYREVA